MSKSKLGLRFLITGGMGGVGSVVARTLAEHGCTITLWYHRTPVAEVESFLQSLVGVGHTARAVDFSDTQAVIRAAELDCRDGNIDGLVHAAVGPLERTAFLQTSIQAMTDSWHRDGLGTFALLQAVGGWLRQKQSGKIFVMTTEALEPEFGGSGLVPYLCTKAAVRQMARQLARELAADHVQVHTIAPGFMATPLQAGVPARWVEMLAEKDPRGRLTTPDDVAQKIVELCEQTQATAQNHLLDRGLCTDL